MSAKVVKMDDTAYVRDLVKKERPAQELFEMDFTQEQVYAIARDFARIVFRGAEKRARLAVDETGIGNYEHKVQQKKGEVLIIRNNLRGKPLMGIIRRDETSRIITFAKPVGIVGAVQPYTNPIVTPIPRRTRILSASRRSRIILSRDGIKDRPIHGWQWGLVKFREVESKSGGAYEH